jgi:hypothetical protein
MAFEIDNCVSKKSKPWFADFRLQPHGLA